MGSETPPRATERREALQDYFEKLLRALGPQRWWPARTRLEVIVGAILVQNTAWQNAALALKKLKQNGLLTLAELKHASLSELGSCVKSAGFYRQKARTIRNFLAWLEGACDGSLTVMFTLPAAELRRRLLEVKGLGPETADAILLYAGLHPVFVADSYTRRILARHGMVPPRAGYAQAQEFLHRHLPADQALFNEYHALLVEVGRRFCRRQIALCDECPLKEFLPRDEARQHLARGETPRLTASTAAWNTGETVSAGCEPR
jgi:endonuclease-3 related protein